MEWISSHKLIWDQLPIFKTSHFFLPWGFEVICRLLWHSNDILCYIVAAFFPEYNMTSDLALTSDIDAIRQILHLYLLIVVLFNLLLIKSPLYKLSFEGLDKIDEVETWREHSKQTLFTQKLGGTPRKIGNLLTEAMFLSNCFDTCYDAMPRLLRGSRVKLLRAN